MRDQETRALDGFVQTDEVSIDAYGRVTVLDPELLEVVSGGAPPTNGTQCQCTNGTCTPKEK